MNKIKKTLVLCYIPFLLGCNKKIPITGFTKQPNLNEEIAISNVDKYFDIKIDSDNANCDGYITISQKNLLHFSSIDVSITLTISYEYYDYANYYPGRLINDSAQVILSLNNTVNDSEMFFDGIANSIFIYKGNMAPFYAIENACGLVRIDAEYKDFVFLDEETKRQDVSDFYGRVVVYYYPSTQKYELTFYVYTEYKSTNSNVLYLVDHVVMNLKVLSDNSIKEITFVACPDIFGIYTKTIDEKLDIKSYSFEWNDAFIINY